FLISPDDRCLSKRWGLVYRHQPKSRNLPRIACRYCPLVGLRIGRCCWNCRGGGGTGLRRAVAPLSHSRPLPCDSGIHLAHQPAGYKVNRRSLHVSHISVRSVCVERVGPRDITCLSCRWSSCCSHLFAKTQHWASSGWGVAVVEIVCQRMHCDDRCRSRERRCCGVL